MIRFHLNELLQQLNISQTKFAHKTNIRPNTINNICNNRTKRVDVWALSQIMKVLNELSDEDIGISEFMEYIDENN